MNPQIDLAELEKSPQILTFDSVELGSTEEGANFNWGEEYSEETVNETGNTIAEIVVIGEKVEVTVTLSEFTLAKFLQVAPHQLEIVDGMDPAKKYVQLGGNVGKKLSTIAKELKLHPINRDATDTSKDLTIWKAIPRANIQAPSNYQNRRGFQVTFVGLPDSTKGNSLAGFGDTTATA
jgi:hypothetical protein